MAPLPDWRSVKSQNRLAVTAVVGVVAGVIGALLSLPRYGPLIGWDAVEVTFLAWVWIAVGPMDPDATSAHARREDPNQAVSDLLLLAAAVAGLVAVGVVLVAADGTHGTKRGVLAGFAVASVALSWLLVHTLFTLRYARLFHQHGGGVDFNQDEPPRYTDFAYLAFTIGMTFQVSDTDLKTHRIRAAALAHGLLSYLFGAVILATTINFIVSLSSNG